MSPDDIAGVHRLQERPVVRSAGESSAFVCRGDGLEAHDVALLLFLDASAYPLDEHCRYAVLRNPAAPRIFDNMEFHVGPPGRKVGPWPGWRGIPEMPVTTIHCGGRSSTLQYQLWGDEQATRTVRAYGILPAAGGDIIITVGDDRLVPVRAEFFAVTLPAVRPARISLSRAFLDRHPRLLIRPDDLPRLRETTSPRRGRRAERISEQLARRNLPLSKTPASKLPPGPEGCAPEDTMLLSAYQALLTPSPEHRSLARDSYLAYVTATRTPGFEPLAIDTQAGETLFLLCVGYDWVSRDLPAEDCAQIREWLWRVAHICWNHLGYERTDYAQAHYLGCGVGLLAFSLLFYEDHPQAPEWTDHFAGVLEWVCTSLPADGFYPHGINMWAYEFSFLLRWLELFRSADILFDWRAYPGLSAISRFRAAATSTDGFLGVTMGDPQYRIGGDSWCHALVAARTGSRQAQWLADLLLDLPVEGVDFRLAPARRRVYEHLWCDDHIIPEPPTDPVMVFPDGGQVFVRSGDFLFTFRSGHPLGEHRYRKGILGAYGHADPCQGSFLLAERSTLVVAGPGPVYRRDSAEHNIITVNGQGQIGDSTVWLPDFFPSEVLPPRPEVRLLGGDVAIYAETSPSYLPHLGVRSMRRSLLVSPGRFVLGIDRVQLKHTARIEWHLHTRGKWREDNEGGTRRWRLTADSRREAMLFLLEPTNGRCSVGSTEFVPAYPHDGSPDVVLTAASPSDDLRFVWCLTLRTDDVPRMLAPAPAGIAFPDGTRAEFDGTWFTIKRNP